jgi:glutamate/aspartate transport system substrate-binding protein
MIQLLVKILASLYFCFFSITSFAVNLDDSTIDKIRETGVIKLGIRENAFPFAMMKNGYAVGYSVDICNRVVLNLEKYLKIPLETKYVPVSATNRIEKLQSGDIDLECGSTTATKAREKEVSFTYPIFVTGARLAVRLGSPITDFKNMRDAHVVVVSGSSCEKIIKPIQLSAKNRDMDFTVTTVKNNNDGVNAVANNEADVFCTDDVLLAGAIATNELSEKLHRVSQPLSIDPYAVMVRKEDQQFLKIIDGIIAKILMNGDAKKFGEKWFSNSEFRYKLNNLTLSAFNFPVKSPAVPE